MTRQNESGFTLIELLVGLALTAAILVLLFSGVGLGFKGMARLDDQVGRIEARRTLAFTLRRQIAAAYPATEAPVVAPTFVGQATTLSFLSLDSNAGPGFSRVWLMLEDGREGRNLVVMRRMQAPDQWFGFERAVLARGVTRFHLDYFGAVAPGESPAWRDSWDGLRVPPELVRVSLALASDGAYAWPDQVIRIWTAQALP
jgi:prepilin-type N-terminal cleavage/methylation domain-containing protein